MKPRTDRIVLGWALACAACACAHDQARLAEFVLLTLSCLVVIFELTRRTRTREEKPKC